MRMSVSILVLLDVSLKAILRYARSAISVSFNPCSFGCQSESAGRIPHRGDGGGFNPCSFGCQSESHVHPVGTGEEWVSILVLLDVSLKACYQGYDVTSLDMFQSLFFWMSV